MSSVSSATDSSGYQYQRDISELEKELRLQAKRLREQTQEDVKRLEDGYKTSLVKKEQATEDAVQKIRDTSKQAIMAEKQKYEAEVDRRNQTHDFGTEKLEKNNRAEQQRLNNEYESGLNQLKKVNEDARNAAQEKNAQNTRALEEHFAKLMSDNSKHDFQKYTELEKNSEKQLNELDKERKLDQQRAELRNEVGLKKANEEKSSALESQAKIYEDSVQQIKASDDEKLRTVEKALHAQKTTLDPKQISPGAEAALRGTLIKDSQKTLDAETERHKAAIEQLQRKYVDQYRRSYEDHETKETRLKQKNVNHQNELLSQLMESMLETEYQAKNKVRDLEVSQTRERDNLIRQFSLMMERQRKEFENTYETSRANAEAKLAHHRQDTDMTAKMTHRAFNQAQNELIRDYEQKLRDQRIENDAKMEDLKTQTLFDIKETERKSKEELIVQGKTYEQRIAQMEAQFKERERNISANYLEELSKARHSYEAINKKKS